MSTATLEADTDMAAYAALPDAERQAYIDGLHADLAEEKAAQAAREERGGEAPPAAPIPGKTAEESGLPERARDESGRFVKDAASASKTSGKGDETPAPADAAPEAKTGTGEEVQDDWRDAGVKDLATQYGIDAAKLAKIPSREVLDVLLESIDQKAFQAGQTAAKPADGGSPKAAEPAAADAPQQATDDALSLVESMKLGDADGNLALEDREPIEKAFKAMAAEIKEMRQFRAGLQQQQEQQQGQAAFAKLKSDFTTAVDSLGHAELFGQPGARTAEQAANLEKVFSEGHLPHARGLIAQGRQVGPTPAFAKAAVNLLFGDQIVQEATQQQLARLKKSAARRTGGGTTKPHALAKDATPLQRNLAEAQENWRLAHGEG